MSTLIKTASDLVTPHTTTVLGFLKQALAKTEKATPYTQSALDFHNALQAVEDISTLDILLDDARYRPGLIAAAGFSTKATTHLSKEELDKAIKQVLSTLQETSGEGLREEIVYRYLLTLGDSLGGSMRNYIGAQAGIRLTQGIIDVLNAKGFNDIQIIKSATKKVQQIRWGKRLILFDMKPKLIGNNVDVILMDSAKAAALKDLFAIPSAYLACGELKGGVDPAGADEHWKTAKSALLRFKRNLRTVGKNSNYSLLGLPSRLEWQMNSSRI